MIAVADVRFFRGITAQGGMLPLRYLRHRWMAIMYSPSPCRHEQGACVLAVFLSRFVHSLGKIVRARPGVYVGYAKYTDHLRAVVFDFFGRHVNIPD